MTAISKDRLRYQQFDTLTKESGPGWQKVFNIFINTKVTTGNLIPRKMVYIFTLRSKMLCLLFLTIHFILLTKNINM